MKENLHGEFTVYIKCLKYCLEYGCELNNKTCYWVTYSGKLEALKICHENNIKWRCLTCKFAAEKGHLECLEYARSNECPRNKLKCIRVAKDNNHQHIVDWIN